MLELIHVGKDYPAPGKTGSVTVLDDISLKVPPAQSFTLVGPSGSGKSTLLNIIGTLDRPTRGQVLLDGQDLGQLDDSAQACLRNRRIGFVFQLHHLLPQCTVLENIMVPTIAAGKALSRSARERAADLLNRVGMTELANHRPAELSGGQRQRVAVVRALINRPQLLLADEPTGSLDAGSADTIFDLLLELNRSEQVTLIIVTHSPTLAAKTEKVLHLDSGHLEERQNSA